MAIPRGVAVHIEDSRYNGIRPSHFDGIRMACDAFEVAVIEIIDLTEDGFYVAGYPRYSSFAEFLDAHPGEIMSLLSPEGALPETINKNGWLVVGPSGGFLDNQKAAYPRVGLDLPPLEGRDALMIALSWA